MKCSIGNKLIDLTTCIGYTLIDGCYYLIFEKMDKPSLVIVYKNSVCADYNTKCINSLINDLNYYNIFYVNIDEYVNKYNIRPKHYSNFFRMDANL
jgi:hypothetical protein